MWAQNRRPGGPADDDDALEGGGGLDERGGPGSNVPALARRDKTRAAILEMEARRAERRKNQRKFRKEIAAEKRRNEREGRPGDVLFQRMIRAFRRDHAGDALPVRAARRRGKERCLHLTPPCRGRARLSSSGSGCRGSASRSARALSTRRNGPRASSPPSRASTHACTSTTAAIVWTASRGTWRTASFDSTTCVRPHASAAASRPPQPCVLQSFGPDDSTEDVYGPTVEPLVHRVLAQGGNGTCFACVGWWPSLPGARSSDPARLAPCPSPRPQVRADGKRQDVHDAGGAAAGGEAAV